MEEKCNSAAICFVSFLPDILDSKAEGRNKYLEMLLAVAEKFKRNPYRQVHSATLIWTLFFYISLIACNTITWVEMYSDLEMTLGFLNFTALFGWVLVSNQILKSTSVLVVMDIPLW